MRTRVLFRVYDLENPRSFESRLSVDRTEAEQIDPVTTRLNEN